MSRNAVKRPAKTAPVAQAQGPKRRRLAATLPEQLDGDACREAISYLIHSHDEASVFQKMKMTFQYHQDLVHDPQRTTDVFKTFPRFLDVKGLVSCPFHLFTLHCFVAWNTLTFLNFVYLYAYVINSWIKTSFCCLELKQPPRCLRSGTQLSGPRLSMRPKTWLSHWAVPTSKSCWETDREW